VPRVRVQGAKEVRLFIAGQPPSRWENPFPRTRCALQREWKAYLGRRKKSRADNHGLDNVHFHERLETTAGLRSWWRRWCSRPSRWTIYRLPYR